MIDLSFTTTAMPRPELLLQTYESLKARFRWLDLKKHTLYINIDSFPESSPDDRKKASACLNIASTFFGNVVANRSEWSSFPRSLAWCLSQPKTEYVFNLEDDWVFIKDIPEDCLEPLLKGANQLFFRAYKIDTPRFVLSPSIIRRSFISPHLNIPHDRNPELYLRSVLTDVSHCVQYPKETNSVVLRDIGRAWCRSQPWKRGENDWTSWTKNDVVLFNQNSEIEEVQRTD